MVLIIHLSVSPWQRVHMSRDREGFTRLSKKYKSRNKLGCHDFPFKLRNKPNLEDTLGAHSFLLPLLCVFVHKIRNLVLAIQLCLRSIAV